MALDLSTLTAEQQLAAVYIGYYDRAADPVGQDFWEGVLADPNFSLAEIATDFATQAETLAAYPFLDAPTIEEAEGFVAEVYLNLFNRAPDQAGLDFWSAALIDAIEGDSPALTVGELILAIIEGAQDTEEGNDRTTILNKIEVSIAWTDAAEAAEIDYASNTAAQNSAKSIIEGVTDEQTTVAAAKATIDSFFEPVGVEGNTILLTSATDINGVPNQITGESFESTDDNDLFLGYIQQNPFAGGISNSLSSADRLDGGAGDDRLYAELTKEFAGVTSDNESSSRTDIQPRLKNIEEIDIEARDDTEDGANPLDTIIVDAKHITDHEEIGSYYSDGDLKIENLTTLTAGGTARNTSEITVTMDHTDNFNSDGDASDLEVLFDNDYLLSGQTSEGIAEFFLLDEKAELNRLNGETVEGRLDEIDKNGIIIGYNGENVEIAFDPELIDIDTPAGETVDTHQQFVNALQAPLQALIADGTLPVGTTIELFEYTEVITDETGKTLNRTGLNDGTLSDLIPAIRVVSGDGSAITAEGYVAPDEITGAFDVFGEFRDEFGETDEPISINIDLHKVGRGGEGGDLIVGGKATSIQDGIAGGIEVFNINVLGAGNDDPNGGMTKPSSLGTIQSTLGALDVVNIATDPMFAQGETFASLEVRDGFGGTLSLIDADDFLGDLTLTNVVNADTITAQGGGDVTLGLFVNEADTAFSVTTGRGDDSIEMYIDGDAVDFADSAVTIMTGEGNDSVLVDFDLVTAPENEQLNQAILDNVLIDTGSGNDTITVDDDAFGLDIGNANILAGEGDDVVYTDGAAINGSNAVWAFNFDNVRADAQGGIGLSDPDELPGVQTSLAYVGGATVTVTLSGAGLDNLAAGGGVMADANSAAGAVARDDGYEVSATISSLINGNEYYGDQRDVNAAVIDAINNDDVLKHLLVASMGANNTVVVASLTSGDFAAIDLRIDINQRDADSDSYANDVLSEAQQLFSNSDLTLTDLWGTTTFATPADYEATAPGANLTTSGTANGWYDGLSVRGGANSADDNLHTAGSASIYEQDNDIDGGAGDDLIVLSTDAVANTVTPFTVSSNNALINGASNQTIVLTGSSIGDDTVMNFTTAGMASTGVNDGIDFLDFTAYLTSMENVSAAPGQDSDTLIPITLDFDTSDVQANEVSVVTFDNTDDDGETFGALGATQIDQLFNNDGSFTGFGDDSFYGNLSAAGANADDEYGQTANTDELINGAAKSILMVENADNDGEYKIFELSWNGDASTDDDSTLDGVVSSTLLGSIDFGDSLDGLTEANFVGSAAYEDLLLNGISFVPVPTYNLVADAPDVDEGNTATFTVTTTNVPDGTVLNYTISGDVNGQDVTGGMTGSVTINGGTGTISVPTVADTTTEGAETMTVSLDNGQGTASVTVNDTSVDPTGNIDLDGGTPSVTAVDGVAETFVYEIDNTVNVGEIASAEGGNITINGFNAMEDSIIFQNVTGSTATTLIPPVVASEDTINNELDFVFDPDASSNSYQLTLVGVSDLNDVSYTVA